MDRVGLRSVLLTMFSVSGVVCALLLVSAEVCGSWTFLYSTYGFILTVPELTPNMGIFW